MKMKSDQEEELKFKVSANKLLLLLKVPTSAGNKKESSHKQEVENS